MPPRAIDLELHRIEIESLLLDLGYTYEQTVQELKTIGLEVSISTLKRRCKNWQIARRQLRLDQSVVDKIKWEFHNTFHNDQQIAAAVGSAVGLDLSIWQVQRIRLAHNWRRRAANDDQLLAQQAETHQRVEQALSDVPRNYGRGHFKAYFISQEQYPARDNDIRQSLRTLDHQGTLARQLGPKKTRQGGEFITRGPDWLWCIDGHDKFRPWGVFIYAAIDAFSRRIIWLTVSNNNRKGVVVLKQMIIATR